MKNLLKFIFLILFTGVAISTNAQIMIGPKAGINIATIGGDDVNDDIMSVIGFQAGAAAEIPVGGIIAIQPEVLFFQKGAKSEYEFLGEKHTSEEFLNYIEIPILIKAIFGDAESLQIFATAGPSIGLGLNGKVKTDDEDVDIDFDESEIKKIDIGASIGVGVQLPAGPGNLFVDIRYLLGLTTTDDSSAEYDSKNRGIGAAVGYLIPIGGQ